MKSFKEIIEEIEEKKEIAGRDAGTDPKSRVVRLGKIKRAKEDLKELYLEYRQHIQSKAAFIICTGSTCAKFDSIAEGVWGCFSVDPEEFYEDITCEVDKRHYTNQISSRALFDLVGSAIEEKAHQVGIIGYPALIFENKYKKLLHNKEEMLAVVKQAFNDKVGAEVVGLDAIEKVARKAVNEGFIGKTAPIVLIAKDEKLAKSLHKDLKKISRNVFIISSGKVSEEIKTISLDYLKTLNDDKVKDSLVKIKENLS